MNRFDRLLLRLAQSRGFVLGSAVVGRDSFGTATESFGPDEYGNYIATSNGVYTCVTSRADLLSSLPLRIYKGAGDDRTMITAGPLYDLIQKVNPFWTFNRLIYMTELSMCLWGEAFWFLERGTSGRQPPREIWWGKPSRVTVIPDAIDYIAGFEYETPNGGKPIRYSPGEVIWFRFPNPLDEFQGLAPLAAARVGADYATDAMRSNRNLFINGMNPGGMLTPKAGTQLTPEQAQELEEQIARRFKGVDKAHRWGVLRFEAELNRLAITPKDAEFLGGLKWSLEDICRAYKWPLDLAGGQRTYENVDAAYRAAWTNAVLPEGRFIASDITEQLVPMFPGQADIAEFDSSEIHVLQVSVSEEWMRAKEQIQIGALLINEWRESQGQKSLPWGDERWAPPAAVIPAETDTEETAETQPRSIIYRRMEFGDVEHERHWRKLLRRIEPQERKWTAMTQDLFRRQRDAVLAKLRAAERSAGDVAANPFAKSEWIKKFRQAARPLLTDIVSEAGEAAFTDLEIVGAFDVLDPGIVRFIERRGQRFGRQVNDTTWQMLAESLQEGVKAGESIDQLADRVETIMGGRIQSTPETIARTEVIGAANGATLDAWEQADVVEGKTWLAALDDRTRDAHVQAHGQTVPIDEPFIVNGEELDFPGADGSAENVVNCRCSMTAVLSERKVSQNGHVRAKEKQL